jgi:hypothetical protein
MLWTVQRLCPQPGDKKALNAGYDQLKPTTQCFIFEQIIPFWNTSASRMLQSKLPLRLVRGAFGKECASRMREKCMSTLYKREEKPPDAPNNLRIEERISVNLPVEITRFDTEGNLFTEQTRIDDITTVGCRFRMQAELKRGHIVSIRPLVQGQKSLAGERPHLFEIMWAAQQGGHWTAGARKLEGEKLANVKFPPANHTPPNTPK